MTGRGHEQQEYLPGYKQEGLLVQEGRPESKDLLLRCQSFHTWLATKD